MMNESAAAWLESIEELRYEDGWTALEELKRLPVVLPRELTPRYLGVCASAYRLAGSQLRNAHRCIDTGRRLAVKLGDRSAQGDLFQREAYLYGERGKFGVALALVERAGGLHLSVGNWTGVGMSSVDQGIFLGHLGRFAAAIKASKTGFRLLPETEHRYRFSALQNLARHHLSSNEPYYALEFLDTAIAIAKNLGPLLVGKGVWLKGTIFLDLKQDSQAEAALSLAFDIYKEKNPIDAALVCIDLLRAKLRQKKVESAQRLVQRAAYLLESLRSNHLASAALIELFRRDVTAISRPLLKRTKALLKKAAERQNRRSA